MDIIFIGDRPAQACSSALNVLDPSPYTGDRLNPFMVHDIIERYVTSKDNTPLHPQHRYGAADRRFVLSTGLAWAPKYTGMVVKQINTLVKHSRVTPIIFVLPVSARHLLSYEINQKLADVCEAHWGNARFLPSLTTERFGPTRYRGFAGNDAYPAEPTPSEALEILNTINTVNYVSEAYP